MVVQDVDHLTEIHLFAAEFVPVDPDDSKVLTGFDCPGSLTIEQAARRSRMGNSFGRIVGRLERSICLKDDFGGWGRERLSPLHGPFRQTPLPRQCLSIRLRPGILFVVGVPTTAKETRHHDGRHRQHIPCSASGITACDVPVSQYSWDWHPRGPFPSKERQEGEGGYSRRSTENFVAVVARRVKSS